MRQSARVLALCLAIILLLSAAACRNRDFGRHRLPKDEADGKSVAADFQCWVKTEDGSEYVLPRDTAADLFEAVVKVFERSDSIETFPDTEGKIMLIFCVGGTAPESVIPAYQLPNSRHCGVYTLFPDDTGRYSDVLLTANVKSFQLKEGAYERIRNMISEAD